jgi:hypothetical protein
MCYAVFKLGRLQEHGTSQEHGASIEHYLPQFQFKRLANSNDGEGYENYDWETV